MSEQNENQSINFSKPTLKIIRSSLEERIAELTQESDKINAELRLHKEALDNIKTISDSIGTTEEDKLDLVLERILADHTEGLSLRTIMRQHLSMTRTAITRDYLIKYLQKRKGIVYEITGERGGAKWKLIEKDDDSETDR